MPEPLDAIRRGLALGGLPPGISRMQKRYFVTYTALGSAVFCFALAFLGDVAGKNLEVIIGYVHDFGLAMVAVAVVAIAGATISFSGLPCQLIGGAWLGYAAVYLLTSNMTESGRARTETPADPSAWAFNPLPTLEPAISRGELEMRLKIPGFSRHF